MTNAVRTRVCGYCARRRPECCMEYGDTCIPRRWRCIDAEECDKSVMRKWKRACAIPPMTHHAR